MVSGLGIRKARRADAGAGHGAAPCGGPPGLAVGGGALTSCSAPSSLRRRATTHPSTQRSPSRPSTRRRSRPKLVSLRWHAPSVTRLARQLMPPPVESTPGRRLGIRDHDEAIRVGILESLNSNRQSRIFSRRRDVCRARPVHGRSSAAPAIGPFTVHDWIIGNIAFRNAEQRVQALEAAPGIYRRISRQIVGDAIARPLVH